MKPIKKIRKMRHLDEARSVWEVESISLINYWLPIKSGLESNWKEQHLL